jgi:hypothetical protein
MEELNMNDWGTRMASRHDRIVVRPLMCKKRAVAHATLKSYFVRICTRAPEGLTCPPPERCHTLFQFPHLVTLLRRGIEMTNLTP